MTAIERDLIAWTKARVRLDEAIFTERFGSPEHARRNSEEAKARVALLRRGMRLLRQEGGSHA